jgi:hypothetical protein
VSNAHADRKTRKYVRFAASSAHRIVAKRPACPRVTATEESRGAAKALRRVDAPSRVDAVGRALEDGGYAVVVVRAAADEALVGGAPGALTAGALTPRALSLQVCVTYVSP